ncbi:MAG: hypothetical protein FWC62_02860 [Firmicutes bacterium]|nr:hypothetical protein [Bacillota bacterium]
MRESSVYFFAVNVAVAVLCGVLIPLIPKLTRKSLLFGVRIPMDQYASPEARGLRKRYTLIGVIGVAIILALIILQYVIFPGITLVSVLYFPLLIGAVATAAFVSSWKQAKKLKEERGWKVSGSVFAETKSSHSRGNLSELPWIWYVLSLVLILASILFALIKYPGLPDKFRMRPGYTYGFLQSQWFDKSLLTATMIPLINLALLIILWLAGTALVRAKLQIDQQNPALSFAQHRIYRRRMGHGLGALILAITVMMALIQLMFLYQDLNIPSWLLLIWPLAAVVVLVVVAVQAGQGGGRIKPKVIPNEAAGDFNDQTAVSTHDDGRGDDQYWAAGMFYHNPDDPKVLVENRFGINVGFNYARLPVKIGVVAFCVVFVALYAWLTVLLSSIS